MLRGLGRSTAGSGGRGGRGWRGARLTHCFEREAVVSWSWTIGESMPGDLRIQCLTQRTLQGKG